MKIFISASIPLLTLFVAGAWSVHRTQLSGTDSPKPDPKPVEEKSAGMWVKTSRLYKGETLELHFNAPNAPFLGVIDPQGHFFYVVFPRESAVGKLKPLVDSERFAKMRRLKINTGSFKADPYTYGVYTNQRVFTRSGTYTFILGENLHIDDPEFVEKVQVKYVHSRRPAPVSDAIAMN